MTALVPRSQRLSRATATLALLVLAAAVSGCAQIGDSMSSAFADPAKYELYDCRQLQTERKNLIGRASDQESFMKKAETGVGGVVVSEMAYRNELISIHAQQKLADEAWRKNKCVEVPDPPAATPTPTPTPAAKGSRAPRSALH